MRLTLRTRKSSCRRNRLQKINICIRPRRSSPLLPVWYLQHDGSRSCLCQPWSTTSPIQGFNCCIFAYGQTGAGKTFSIMGDINELQKDTYSPSRGILPRLLEDLFNSTSQSQTTYQVTCSYIEIYNEQIYDLVPSLLPSYLKTKEFIRSDKITAKVFLSKEQLKPKYNLTDRQSIFSWKEIKPEE